MAEHSADDDAGMRVLATVASEPEADLMRQRLANADIASVSQRTIGGPEFGLSGARYVYVQAAELERARDVLGLAPPPANA
jgi:hypothetical protein